IDQRGDSETDRIDLAARALPRLLHRVDHHVEQVGLVEAVQSALDAVMHGQLGINRTSQQLRTAHVDANRAPARHAVTIWVNAQRPRTTPLQALSLGTQGSEGPP